MEAGHEVCLAVTQPDKPKGRGKEMQFNTGERERQIRHGIHCVSAEACKRAGVYRGASESIQADVMVVICVRTDFCQKKFWSLTQRMDVSMYMPLCFRSIGERHRSNGRFFAEKR